MLISQYQEQHWNIGLHNKLMPWALTGDRLKTEIEYEGDSKVS